MTPESKLILTPSRVRFPDEFYRKHSLISGPIRTPIRVDIDTIELLLKEEIPNLVLLETISLSGVWQEPVTLTVENFQKRYGEICKEQGIHFNSEFFTEETVNQAHLYEDVSPENDIIIEDGESAEAVIITNIEPEPVTDELVQGSVVEPVVEEAALIVEPVVEEAEPVVAQVSANSFSKKSSRRG